MENWEKTWFFFLQTWFFLLSLRKQLSQTHLGLPCSWKSALWNFGYLWHGPKISAAGISAAPPAPHVSPKGNVVSHFYPVKGPGCWITIGDSSCRTWHGSPETHGQSRAGMVSVTRSPCPGQRGTQGPCHQAVTSGWTLAKGGQIAFAWMEAGWKQYGLLHQSLQT